MRKSISKERTFRELSDPDALLAKCKEIATALGEEMMKKGLKVVENFIRAN